MEQGERNNRLRDLGQGIASYAKRSFPTHSLKDWYR
jgi:hypothetical protein